MTTGGAADVIVDAARAMLSTEPYGDLTNPVITGMLIASEICRGTVHVCAECQTTSAFTRPEPVVEPGLWLCSRCSGLDEVTP